MDREDQAFLSAAMWGAILAGTSGFAYSVAFVVLRNGGLAALMLTAGGLLSVVALVAVFRLAGEASPGLATVGLVLGAVGVLGAAVHGAYDLANTITPAAEASQLPNAVDPRGFLTFGVAGLGVSVLSALALRTAKVPRGWAWLGLLLGALLIVIYMARLIVVDATSPLILAPAALAGFVVNPIWYVWLGVILRRAAD